MDFDNIEWFRNFGWNDNPFKIKPDPSHIVGFIDLRTLILTYMKSEDPFIVTGPSGSGKTTLLKWLEEQKKDSLYFNFLEDIDEKEFKKKIEGSFLEKLLRRFFNTKKLVLIDEVQDMPSHLLKWIRGKFDEGEISSLVLASIKEDLKNLEEPFVERIGSRIVAVRNLKEDEALKMVKHRIFSKGKVNPFTDEGLKSIFEYSDFSPRKILENCETCCIYAGTKGLRYVNQDVVSDALKGLKVESVEKEPFKPKESEIDLKNLSPSQQKILRILQDGNQTTNKIAEVMSASRASVAKQLSRLSFKTDKKLLESKGFCSPLVEAKNRGRPVIYGLTAEAKKLFLN